MFDKILIANRGEIACRIARSAKRLGISVVGVYSDADRRAMHVGLCDEAVYIGESAAQKSYLDAEKVIDAAVRTGAQAIHPGYGFLSENADFVRAVEAAGLTFIGPSADAIDAMGSKSNAKEMMGEAGVPLVPGYHGDCQEDGFLVAEADKVGYPLLIKASAGGGGKGMRIVESADQFTESLESCRRESMAAFKDDHMLLERYLIRPRHVELQIFADQQGNCVYVFERDCSVQRRHQKVLEEAPAPGMTSELRTRMSEAAINAAKAINYVGAGTVEFLLDEDGSFYFMEMNTRLQVEHPVSELISGQDLVEWQLRVAAGEPLPVKQQDLVINGHAIEARIYAENPERDFLPSTGHLLALNEPQQNVHVRIDTGVRQGDEISSYYDPMLAKLIVWDIDRESALRRMVDALGQYQVLGVQSNIAYLRRICQHPAFAGAELDTSFIDKYEDDLRESARAVDARALALAAVYQYRQLERDSQLQAQQSGEPDSPWYIVDGWRGNIESWHVFHFQTEDDYQVEIKPEGEGYRLRIDGNEHYAYLVHELQHDFVMALDDRSFSAAVTADESQISLSIQDQICILKYRNLNEGDEDSGSGNNLVAPMPGNVVAVLVEAGACVSEGETLMVLEAMKMELPICAAADCVIEAVHYAVGEKVEEGTQLLTIVSQDEDE